MGEKVLATLSEAILETLKANANQMAPAQLISEVREKFATVSEDDIRHVVWRLIDEHKLEVDRNWRVSAAA